MQPRCWSGSAQIDDLARAPDHRLGRPAPDRRCQPVGAGGSGVFGQRLRVRHLAFASPWFHYVMTSPEAFAALVGRLAVADRPDRRRRFAALRRRAVEAIARRWRQQHQPAIPGKLALPSPSGSSRSPIWSSVRSAPVAASTRCQRSPAASGTSSVRPSGDHATVVAPGTVDHRAVRRSRRSRPADRAARQHRRPPRRRRPGWSRSRPVPTASSCRCAPVAGSSASSAVSVATSSVRPSALKSSDADRPGTGSEVGRAAVDVDDRDGAVALVVGQHVGAGPPGRRRRTDRPRASSRSPVPSPSTTRRSVALAVGDAEAVLRRPAHVARRRLLRTSGQRTVPVPGSTAYSDVVAGDGDEPAVRRPGGRRVAAEQAAGAVAAQHPDAGVRGQQQPPGRARSASGAGTVARGASRTIRSCR